MVTRYLWWALLGLATILGLRNLFRISQLSLIEKIETGGLLGVILLSALGLFATERGSQFSRYLLYAPLFCAPILLRFLFSRTWARKALVVLVVLVFVLSLPTFLSSSTLGMGDIIGSIIGLTVIYTVLLVVEVFLMVKFIRLGPSSLHTGRYHFETPAAATGPREI